MDSVSATEAAARLGTSVPRVVRAIGRLAPEARGSNGRYSLTEANIARLRSDLGVATPVSGLAPTEIKVLAALARAPLGLRSVRAVAEHARVSPTATSRALRSLLSRDLVFIETLVVAAGHVRRVTIWHANRLHPRWSELSPALLRVLPPLRAGPSSERVPQRLRHLFWNTADSQLDVAHAGAYIARRLLRTMDPEGLAWGASNLTANDWRYAACARGLEPAVKALGENLAAAGESA